MAKRIQKRSESARPSSGGRSMVKQPSVTNGTSLIILSIGGHRGPRCKGSWSTSTCRRDASTPQRADASTPRRVDASTRRRVLQKPLATGPLFRRVDSPSHASRRAKYFYRKVLLEMALLIFSFVGPRSPILFVLWGPDRQFVSFCGARIA